VTVPGGPSFAAPDDDQTRDPWAVQLAEPGNPAEATGSILPAQPRPGGGRRRGLVGLVAAGAAVVVAAGGGLAWAAFNGDTANQPERHLPRTTDAVMKVDLDPSGPQKIEAARFLSKFPDSGTSKDGDLRKLVYDRLAESGSRVPPWEEVRDWIGDRAAVAVVTEAEGPVVVLQVEDEAKARASLGSSAVRLPAGSFTVADGWATISDTKAHLDAVTGALAQGTLADDGAFRRDVDALGDAGVISAWADFSRLSALTQRLAGGLAGAGLLGGGLLGASGVDPSGADAADAALKQRVALTARFTGGNAELVARTFGGTPPKLPAEAGAAAAALPRDTVAALAVSGGGSTVTEQWKSLRQRLGTAGDDIIAAARRDTGLHLPGDLVALLGRRFAVAVGAPAAGAGEPVIGVRGTSDDPGLGAALDRLLQLTDRSGLPLERRDVPGGYVLATSRQEAQALTGSGDLGSSAAFRDAVPAPDKAFAVVYVDVEHMASYAGLAGAQTASAISPLRAVGLSATGTDDGAQLTVRVTTK
jgi:hypothetical protein